MVDDMNKYGSACKYQFSVVFHMVNDTKSYVGDSLVWARANVYSEVQKVGCEAHFRLIE